VPRELPHASPAKKRMKLSIGVRHRCRSVRLAPLPLALTVCGVACLQGDGPAKSLKLATVTGATGIDGSPSVRSGRDAGCWMLTDWLSVRKLVVAGNLGGAGGALARVRAPQLQEHTVLTPIRRVSGGVDQHRLSVGKGKGKPFDAAFLTAGPLADAISELRAVVAQVC